MPAFLSIILIFFAAMWDVFIIVNIILFIVLFWGYCVLIFNYERWFEKLRYFTPVPAQPVTSFSIIIPARDEEDNIEKCILSILANDYPIEYFEIIVADDFSTDATPQIVQRLGEQYPNVKLMQLANFVTSKLLQEKSDRNIHSAGGA